MTRLKQYALGGLVGAVIGCSAAFVYFNVSPFERMAADASGFAPWTLWGLPFTVPYGLFGGLVSTALVFLARLRRPGRGADGPSNAR
jgi:hypothetical protein